MSRRSDGCGLEAVIDVIGGKWKPLILWHLALGARRFGELRRQVTNISEKMLIQNLREMDADGIVARKDFHEVPQRVEYSLTELGLSLADVLKPLCEWGATHMNAIEAKKVQCTTPGPGRGQSGKRKLDQTYIHSHINKS